MLLDVGPRESEAPAGTRQPQLQRRGGGLELREVEGEAISPVVDLAEEDYEVSNRLGVNRGVEDAGRGSGDRDGVMELTEPESQGCSDEIGVGGGFAGQGHDLKWDGQGGRRAGCERCERHRVEVEQQEGGQGNSRAHGAGSRRGLLDVRRECVPARGELSPEAA